MVTGLMVTWSVVTRSVVYRLVVTWSVMTGSMVHGLLVDRSMMDRLMTDGLVVDRLMMNGLMICRFVVNRFVRSWCIGFRIEEFEHSFLSEVRIVYWFCMRNFIFLKFLKMCFKS